jgi:aerobic carbon-monoxide dehydrogenase medium subunit
MQPTASRGFERLRRAPVRQEDQVEYVEPTSLADAVALLHVDPEGAKAVAGGTAIVLMMRQGLFSPERLVSLSRLPGLRDINVVDGHLRIGALVSLTQVARSPLVRRHAPSVAVAASVVANPRIRNAATIGGNLAEADYASDPPAALISWGARCQVTGSNGARVLPAADLITGFYTTALAHDELITAVEIPLVTGDVRSTYGKYRSRSSEDRPCAGVAARVVLSGVVVTEADVVVGAVAAVPHRLPHVTEALVGSPLSAAAAARTASQYAESLEPIEDSRGSAWYRRRVVGVLVRRALETLATQEEAVS